MFCSLIKLNTEWQNPFLFMKYFYDKKIMPQPAMDIV